MPETRSMTSKMAKELETLTVEITKLKEQIEQSREKELTEEVARLRKHIEQSKEPELREEIECLKERMETSKEGELFAEIASLRKQLEQSKEQELRVEIEKLKAHIEESKDLDVQKDITEIRQILEHLKAEQHVIVNSKESIKSSTARLTLPALSHFSGGSGEEIIEYSDTFQPSTAGLQQTDYVYHHIDTGNAKPSNSPPYRLSPTERQIISEQIDSMLHDDIISPSQSPWASPIILVKKQDGKQVFTNRPPPRYQAVSAIISKDRIRRKIQLTKSGHYPRTLCQSLSDKSLLAVT